MRPSTIAELAGFAFLSYAAFLLAPVAGLAVGGFSLLVIGYAVEDERSLLTLRRVFGVWGLRRRLRRAKQATKRAERLKKAS